jgi:hypothetical protein
MMILPKERYDKLLRELSHPATDGNGMLTERGLRDVQAYVVLTFGIVQGIIKKGGTDEKGTSKASSTQYAEAGQDGRSAVLGG